MFRDKYNGEEREDAMQLGMIGLGRMGANMVSRLLRGGHQCVVFDTNPATVQTLVNAGAVGATSLDEFVARLTLPRVVWVMVPAAVVDRTLRDLSARLQQDDIVIDRGDDVVEGGVGRSCQR